jgi:hypothetical protein
VRKTNTKRVGEGNDLDKFNLPLDQRLPNHRYDESNLDDESSGSSVDEVSSESSLDGELDDEPRGWKKYFYPLGETFPSAACCHGCARMVENPEEVLMVTGMQFKSRSRPII